MTEEPTEPGMADGSRTTDGSPLPQGPPPDAPSLASAGIDRPARWPALVGAAVLACLVVAIFLPVVRFPFVDLDTQKQVVDNSYIQGLTIDHVRHIFTSRCIDSYYPVRTLTFALDHQLWGLDGGRFKRTNGLVHLANTLLVFWLVLRLFRHPLAPEGTPKAWWDAAVATTSAGVFAVHPLVVEPVAWVPGREELLMTLGALGCLHFHLTARRLDTEGRPRAALACYASAALCCAAACLSNAVAAVIPLLITAWDCVTLARPKLRRILYGTSVLWLIGLATIVAKRMGGRPPRTDVPQVFSSEWVIAILNTYWLNLTSLVWPTKLAIFYTWPPARNLGDAGVILGGIAIGLTGVLLWALRRRKLVLFGLVWYGLALAPASQIMPHHIARADRFLYLPLVGLVVAAAMGLRPLQHSRKRRETLGGVVAAGCLTLLLLGILSAGQVRTWRDAGSMWKNCLRVDRDNATAHSGVADNLSRAGRFDEAKPHYLVALKLDPKNIETLNNFSLRLAADDNVALRDYELAILLAQRGCKLTEGEESKLPHTLSMAYSNFAASLKEKDQFAQAIEAYHLAIRADPAYDIPQFNLALLLATCSDPKLRDPERAVPLAEKADKLPKPPDAGRLMILATVYAEVGRFDQAAATIQRALRLPQPADDPAATAELRRRLKRYREQAAASRAP